MNGVWVPEDGDSCHKTGKIDRCLPNVSKGIVYEICSSLPLIENIIGSSYCDAQLFPNNMFSDLSFNHLKKKRRLLYLKALSVPRCKHFSSRL